LNDLMKEEKPRPTKRKISETNTILSIKLPCSDIKESWCLAQGN